MEKMCDCLIIGGGLTAQIAGMELAGKGYRTILMRTGAGASPHISGLNIPMADPADSIQAYRADTESAGRGQGDPALVTALCGDSEDLVPYLEGLGFVFDRTGDGRLKARKSLGSSFARVVGNGNSSGARILAAAGDRIREYENAEVLENTRALRLIRKDAAVCGVLAYDRTNRRMVTIGCRAVLVASGGFCGIFPFTSNPPDLSGDGAAMALLAGAKLTDMEFVQFEPSGAVYPEAIRGKGMITTLFYEGAVMKNGLGKRFMLDYSDQGERVNKDVLSRCIAKEILEGRASEHGGVYFDASGVDEKRMHECYQPFIDRYAAVGIDLLHEPVELGNAAHTALGGILVDEMCWTRVPGLYAAGEAAGGLHGANRIGGSAGTEVLVFGRRAAASISSDLARTGSEAVSVPDAADGLLDVLPYHRGTRKPGRDDLHGMRSEMQTLLGENLGVFREEAALSKTCAVLSGFYEKVRNAPIGEDAEDAYRLLRLENDLLTALSLSLSAKERKNSCGCHQRADYPNEPDACFRTTVTFRQGMPEVTTG